MVKSLLNAVLLSGISKAASYSYPYKNKTKAGSCLVL